jgi:hypothetical protein
MLTEDLTHFPQLCKMTPKQIWNVAILAAIQTVNDVCEEDYKLMAENGRLIESYLRILMFED